MADETHELPQSARASWLEMNPVIKGELIRLMLEGGLACEEMCHNIGRNILADACEQ